MAKVSDGKYSVVKTKRKNRRQGKWQNPAIMEKQEISELQKRKEELTGVGAEEITSFAKLPLSKKTLRGLEDAEYEEPTKIQRESLIFSLCGKDVVGAAKTGSGKTLAFIIPLLEMLYSKIWTTFDGPGAVVITPTRELAYQIFEVLKVVGKYHDFSAGLVIGGKDLHYEWDRVGNCNIIICTPGRLLQHMTENADFRCENVQMVILDEADQCLSMGFSDAMNCILQELPYDRQTLLFSATQTKNVKSLINAGCKNPIYCSVHEYSKTVTPKKLKESYVVCEVHDKLTFLYSFLKFHKGTKIIVFLSTCKQVKFYWAVFRKLNFNSTMLGLYGTLHQLRRMAIYDEFCRKKSVILFATDVAARGLDIPAVDWVVHADCPEDVTAYIHRAGRTARYRNSGESLLVLTPSEEEAMLNNLKMRNIILEKLEVDPRQLMTVLHKVDAMVCKDMELKEDAKRAFKSYIKHITMMRDKKVFDATSIDGSKFARSLGLVVTPRVRFLERRLKKMDQCVLSTNKENVLDSPSGSNEAPTTLNFGMDDSSDDEFLKSTKGRRSTHASQSEDGSDDSQNENTASEELNGLQKKNSKHRVVTKAALAKKLQKKGLQLNSRTVFDDEGEEIRDHTKQQVTEAAREDDGVTDGGINIGKLQEIMKEEDKTDRKIHNQIIRERTRVKKEKMKKLARRGVVDEEDYDEDESDFGEDTQKIIDELPDPDEVYSKGSEVTDGKCEDVEKEDDTESETDRGRDDSSSESTSEDEVDLSDKEENVGKPSAAAKASFSGRQMAKKLYRERKRARLMESNTLTALDIGEKEQLALYLLSGGK